MSWKLFLSLSIKRVKTSKKAFTLIELMIVTVIVGVVASMGIVSYIKYYKKSLERNMEQALLQFGAANKIYKSKRGHYWVPDAQVSDAVVMVDSICNPVYGSQNDPGICTAYEQVRTVLIQMQPNAIDDFYRARNTGQEFSYSVYTQLTSMGPSTVMVYDSATNSVCCNDAAVCLLTPTCP